jgi:hypothetical protein
MSGRGAKLNRRIKEAKEIERVQERLALDPVGTGGASARPEITSNMTYVVVPRFEEGDPRNENSNGALGSKGIYEATFVLAIPGHDIVQTEVNFEELLNKGDSLLRAPDNAETMTIYLADNAESNNNIAKAEVGINEYHRFQYIRFKCSALNFQDAGKISHNVVMPILSRWAFQHDVAITANAVELHEIKTSARSYSMQIMGRVKSFSDIGGASTNEGRILLATYREGISSPEPLYQALCMFKVIEGCYVLRARRKKDALSKSKPYSDPGEKLSFNQITTTNERSRHALTQAFSPYLGKKFTNLRDIFRENIRHAIAHLDLDGDPFAADSHDDVSKVYQSLPVMKHMARMLAVSELNIDL